MNAATIMNWLREKVDYLRSRVIQISNYARAVPKVSFFFEGMAAELRTRQAYRATGVRHYLRATIDAEGKPLGRDLIITFMIDEVDQTQTATLTAGENNGETIFDEALEVQAGEVPGAKMTQVGLLTPGNSPGASIWVWLHEDVL